jgi:lysophospholipid acyltransferase (LPLAT)-like uncharacterized protein
MGVNSAGRRISLWLVTVLYSLLSRLLFASCRVSIEGEGLDTFEKRVAKNEPLIAAFWHYGVIFFPYLTRGSKWTAMVSASEDGEYISRILESIGYQTVRGSSNRLGVSALKKIITLMRKGYNAGIVADGSQGPARQAQSGPVLLSARTGCPVIPMSWSASAYWTFKSWDRTILPKPFARIFVCFGPPFYVPKETKKEAIETYRRRLEDQLDETYRTVWRRMGKEGHLGT